MILIVGLGNPGKKYQKTRHNVGFIAVDELQKNPGFSDWELKKKFRAETSRGTVREKETILAKPQTFMNESGKAVKSLSKMYHPNKAMAELSEHLWIVHDDIDLPLGKMKITKNRGAAGHKGVQSIINELGTKNFVRFRIGIQPKTGDPKNVEKFVLQKFTKDEEKKLEEIIKKACQAIEMAVKDGTEKAMTQYNC